MAYRLERHEALPDGMRRVVVEQLDAALEQLRAGTDASWDDVVHDVRRRLKRVRAVLKLARDELGDERYRRENTAVRDAARPLSEVRDARILLVTFDGLAGDAAPAELRVPLVERHRALRRDLSDGDVTDAVETRLEAVRARVPAWPLWRDEWACVAGGLHRTYRRGKRRHADAFTDPSSEAPRSCGPPRAPDPAMERLHEWRKRVKDLWHHLELLRPAWPPVLAGLADQAHALSDHLGDDHDLGVLAGILTEAEHPDLLAELERRREAHRHAADLLGRRVYAERPRAFTDRLGAYWRAARAEVASPTLRCARSSAGPPSR